jgi:GH25 family lysozyme M1 (1,4-beta-N-acetylmuramidase)
MTNLYMWDDTVPSSIPSDAEYIAYYVDGRYKNGDQIAQLFPHAHLLGIAVSPADDADALDVETGDAVNADVYAWLERQLARKIWRPVIYTSADNVGSLMLTMNANRFSRDQYRLWSAHYTGTAHICGPDTCKATQTAVDGTQFTDQALGKSLDESMLAASFEPAPTTSAPPPPAPTPPPAPATPQITLDIDGTKVVLEKGKTYSLTLS